MNDEIRSKLKILLSQANRAELLDDPPRLSELIRERLGMANRREAGVLIMLLREDVPKRLLAMSASSRSDTMLDNYAKKLSEDIGLKEDMARDAIATWAEALGLGIAAAAGSAGSAGNRELPFEMRRAQERERLRNEQAAQTAQPQDTAEERARAARTGWTAPQPAPAPQPPPGPGQPAAAGRPVYAQAFKLLREQKPPAQVRAELQAAGVDSTTASHIVTRVGEAITIMREAYRKAGMKAAGIGAAWCVGGILFTAITYSIASGGRGGGTYFVAWGAVLFGAVQAIRGLIVAGRQPSENEIMSLIGLG
jgi:hypothetical protein